MDTNLIVVALTPDISSWTWDFSCDEDLVSSEDNLNLSINWYHYLCLSLFSFQARLINKSSDVCTKQGERTVQLNGTNGFISKSPEAFNESQGFTITIHLSQTPGDRGWVSCCCSVILHIRSRNPIFLFSLRCGTAAASWLVCSPLDWVAWVQALARDTVLCSCVLGQSTWRQLTVPLFTQA